MSPISQELVHLFPKFHQPRVKEILYTSTRSKIGDNPLTIIIITIVIIATLYENKLRKKYQ